MIEYILNGYKDGTYYVVSTRVYNSFEMARDAVYCGFVDDTCIEEYIIEDGVIYFIGADVL